MPNYKDGNNKVHFLDDAKFEYLLPVGSVPITDAEVAILQAPTSEELIAIAKSIQEQQDAQDAKNYTKLQALSAMTPVQIQAWVQANVNTLADAKDALKTLAVAVGILARGL